jgi:uncharacterized protein involved in exopolysaccharide biosynthesis
MDERNKTRQFNNEIKNEVEMLEKQSQKLQKEKEGLIKDIESLNTKNKKFVLNNKSAQR